MKSCPVDADQVGTWHPSPALGWQGAAVTIDRYELVDRFGRATDAGVGALFVGAGLSMGAGLPSWGALLGGLTRRLRIPASVTDLPLAAQYCEQAPDGGRSPLENHLLEQLKDVRDPGPGHALIARLPVREVWTTNYDRLIETAMAQAGVDVHVAVGDEDLREVGTGRRSVIKMHGSLSAESPPRWQPPPVVTRGDYERYETERLRTWAQLRASYLTRTMLFLGFSFADPNVAVLLRLARLSDTAASDRHLAVLRKPTKAVEVRVHELLVDDLKASGVAVHEISDFDELTPLLQALVRRTQPLRCFIAGSGKYEALGPWCESVAAVVALRAGWELASLAGDAGRWMTQEVAKLRNEAGTYQAERLPMYFRERVGEAAPLLENRAGTAIFTYLSREELVPSVLEECRAMLVLGGGSRTTEEVGWARERGLGVVPLAASGGAARQAWESVDADQVLLGGRRVDAGEWARLGHDDRGIAAAAAVRLLAQAMYDAPTS